MLALDLPFFMMGGTLFCRDLIVKKFGFIVHSPEKKFFLNKIHFSYVLLLFFCLIFFGTISSFRFLLTSAGKDIFQVDMKRVAFYFWGIDPQLSDFTLRVDDLAQSYMSGVSVLKNSDELDKALQYVYFNAEKL
ncbi:MAG TPA: hypothetical protein PKD96_02760, partial [Candidatus Absconditabacterales bacterium]|nr:hypothetical protein [Candidatus Absconditabacterales bacterium]